MITYKDTNSYVREKETLRRFFSKIKHLNHLPRIIIFETTSFKLSIYIIIYTK